MEKKGVILLQIKLEKLKTWLKWWNENAFLVMCNLG